MTSSRRHLWVGALALGLAACASAPMHYYTLVPAAAGAAAPASPAPFQFELLPVAVPAQVDLPQLVIRQGGQGAAVLNGERWIAPLADEVHAAVAADLAQELGTQDMTGLPAGDKPRLRIKLDLHRFDSMPGEAALIDAVWSVHSLKDGGSVTCASHLRETVGPGYDDLVQGHQRALARLAHGIAVTARVLGAGRAAGCPE
jgi:uncharacterized protein